jgi:AraC-like DNA-binding protein
LAPGRHKGGRSAQKSIGRLPLGGGAPAKNQRTIGKISAPSDGAKKIPDGGTLMDRAYANGASVRRPVSDPSGRGTLSPPIRRQARFDSIAPDFEIIVGQPHQSFRWNVHGYPHDLARWNYHPEYELHLTQRSSGKMFVGDYIGNFEPGSLVLTGPNLPHNWVSDLSPGEEVKDRDMLIQFTDELMRGLMRISPELEEIEPLLDDARLGIEFYGDAAKLGARFLRRIGQATAARRMVLFLEMLDELNRSTERRTLSSREYEPTLNHAVSETVNRVTDYLIRNLTEEIRLSDVARFCGMSDSVFSRFFKKNTGHGFVRYLNRMRINRACMLLTQGDRPITDICFETGFNNLSNFNRQFRAFYGVTPSEYRRQARRNATKSLQLFAMDRRDGSETSCVPAGVLS